MLVFLVAALVSHLILGRTRHGFSTYMPGSNIEAARYSGLHTKRTLTLVYTISGAICAVAGIVMLALVILQMLSSGLNPFGANQHLATAMWGIFLIAVMIGRWGWRRWRARRIGVA